MESNYRSLTASSKLFTHISVSSNRPFLTFLNSSSKRDEIHNALKKKKKKKKKKSIVRLISVRKNANYSGRQSVKASTGEV